MAAAGSLPERASGEFIRWLHERFYLGAPERMLTVGGAHGPCVVEPGHWRTTASQDVAVGRLVPPASSRVEAFMDYFEERYRFSNLGTSGRIVSMAVAHHRFNYIHPVPDGNGRVSRLMSHAMGHIAQIGAHGLWSVSRGLARGLRDRGEY